MRTADYFKLTTTSVAGTGGNGAITLSTITGYPTLAAVFGSSNTLDVRYVVEDTVNHKFETGLGQIALSTGVLTRSTPQVVWDGATYTEGAPTALSLGSSPTSGNIVISFSAVAEQIAPNVEVMQTTVAGDATWRDYPISTHMVNWNNNGSGGGTVTNRETYLYYRNERAGRLLGIQFVVTGAGAGQHAKLALYPVGKDGLPGTKIVDFVTQSLAAAVTITDTATGSWTPAGAPFLKPAGYYVGWLSDNNLAVILSASPGAQIQTPVGRVSGYGYGNGVYIAGNYATGLPTNPSLAGGSMIDPGALGTYWLGLKVQP